MTFGVLSSALKEKESQRKVLWALGNLRSFRTKYFDFLRYFLRRVSNKVSGGAWSSGAYDWALRIAFWYPVTVYILTWLTFGNATAGLGGGLADGAPIQNRLLVLASLFASVVLYDRATQSSIREWAFYSFAAVGLLAVAAFFGAGGGSFAVIAAVCVASTVSIINGARGAIKKQRRYGTATAFLGGAVAGFLLSLLFPLMPITASFSSAMLLIGVIALIASAFSFFGEIARVKGRIGVFLVGQWLAFVVAGLLVSKYVDARDFDPAFVSLYVMWGILPFVNAPFDWVSFGITVTLITNMIDTSGAQIVRNTILDYLAGVALLFLLTFLLIVILGLYHQVATANGHASIIDPMAIIANIRAHPLDPKVFWVYAMVSTTVLPTLVHTTAAAASIWTRLTDHLGPWVKRQPKGDLANDFLMRSLVSAYLTAGVVVIISLSAFFAAAAFYFIVLVAPTVGSAMLAMGEAIVPELARVAEFFLF